MSSSMLATMSGTVSSMLSPRNDPFIDHNSEGDIEPSLWGYVVIGTIAVTATVAIAVGIGCYYQQWKRRHTYEILPDQDGLDDNDDYLINDGTASAKDDPVEAAEREIPAIKSEAKTSWPMWSSAVRQRSTTVTTSQSARLGATG